MAIGLLLSMEKSTVWATVSKLRINGINNTVPLYKGKQKFEVKRPPGTFRSSSRFLYRFSVIFFMYLLVLLNLNIILYINMIFKL